jgi:hypothetical protein
MTSKSEIEAAFEAATAQDSLCNVGKMLRDVDPEARKVIQSKLDDEIRYSGAVISRVLKGLGLPPVTGEGVSKHRRGACRCR